MSDQPIRKEWHPAAYHIGKLCENELMTTDLTPWEPGMKGYAVDLQDGRRMEVFFTLPMKKGAEFVRLEPEHPDVCAAVVELFGWISGKD